MDVDKLLEELRAQRQLIQNHLKWLDNKIDSLECGKLGLSRKSTSEDKSENEETLPGESPPAEPTEEREIEPAEDSDPLYSKYKAPTGNELYRAKIGCLVLFVLSTTLFLFLLFGLPYLLD